MKKNQQSARKDGQKKGLFARKKAQPKGIQKKPVDLAASPKPVVQKRYHPKPIQERVANSKKSVNMAVQTLNLSKSFLRIFGVVACLLMLVLVQQLILTKLDATLNALNTSYNEILDSNNSKRGLIVESRDLEAIEAEARSYGMTEPGENQIITMSYMDMPKNQGAFSGNTWFERLFE